MVSMALYDDATKTVVLSILALIQIEIGVGKGESRTPWNDENDIGVSWCNHHVIK